MFYEILKVDGTVVSMKSGLFVIWSFAYGIYFDMRQNHFTCFFVGHNCGFLVLYN